jgi:hypothetical protein
VMAVPRLEEPKLVQESPRLPSVANPYLPTQADVRVSQNVAGKGPKAEAVQASSTTGQPRAAQVTESTPNPGQTGGTPAPSSTPASNGTGGTPAPVSTQGVGGTSSGGNTTPTVPTATGAPPGVPNTSVTVPTIGLPPTPKSIQGQSAAEADFTQAQNEREGRLYEAALKYNGGPNSELETNRIKSEIENRNLVGKLGAAGTIESSLKDEGQSKIAQSEAELNERSYETYQRAVTEANSALLKAQIIYERASEQEKREMAEQAERLEQKEPLVPPQPAPNSNVYKGPPSAPGPYAGSQEQQYYKNKNVVRT